MTKEIIHSYARITYCLDILGKLPNGYHELSTIKQKIDLHDTIEVEDGVSMSFESSGISVPSKNSILETVEFVKKRFGIERNLHIKVHKRIPLEGGLAGGSANAASILLALHTLWRLPCTTEELSLLAQSLGRDIPFFLCGNTALDSENALPVAIPSKLPPLWFVLFKPPQGILSRGAYQYVDSTFVAKNTAKTRDAISSISKGTADGLIGNFHNDFFYILRPHYPFLETMHNDALECGGTMPTLSGSGSSMFCAFTHREAAEVFSEKLHYKYQDCFVTCSVRS